MHGTGPHLHIPSLTHAPPGIRKWTERKLYLTRNHRSFEAEGLRAGFHGLKSQPGPPLIGSPTLRCSFRADVRLSQQHRALTMTIPDEVRTWDCTKRYKIGDPTRLISSCAVVDHVAAWSLGDLRTLITTFKSS